MRLLIVNYFFEPVTDAHAYRWSQIASYWARQGHQVEVICSTVRSSSGSGPIDIRVKRTGLFPAKILRAESLKPDSAAHRRIGMLRFLKILYRKIFWPDGLWHWFPTLALELYKRRKDRYDAVISYSPTFSAHLAILLFRRISANTFFWIADYGDPFSTSMSMQPNNFQLYGSLNRLVEKAVLRAASLVSFTNESTLRDYCSYFGFSYRFKVVPHAVDVESFQREVFRSVAVDGSEYHRVRMVYVGGFHKNIREPYEMLDLFQRLSRESNLELVLDIYGPLNGLDISQYLSPEIQWHGSVPREAAISIIQNSDILINVGNKGCAMSPSKVVEYVATGKPILNIQSECRQSNLLNLYWTTGQVFNYGPVVTDSTLPRLAEFVSNRRFTVLDRKSIDSILGCLTIQCVADDYLSSVSKECLC